MNSTTPEVTYNVYDLEMNPILTEVSQDHMEWFFGIEIIENFIIEAL